MAALMITTVPRSGWARIRRIGTAAIASAFATSRSVGLASVSRFSARIIEIPTMMPIFANSAGWILKPPGRAIQARAPLIVLPTCGIKTAIKPSTASPQTIGV